MLSATDMRTEKTYIIRRSVEDGIECTDSAELMHISTLYEHKVAFYEMNFLFYFLFFTSVTLSYAQCQAIDTRTDNSNGLRKRRRNTKRIIQA